MCICVLSDRYLQADLETFDLRDLKCKFDVILLEPPLEEYYRESGIIASERFWTWDDVSATFITRLSDLFLRLFSQEDIKVSSLSHSLQIMKLEIDEISALRSFVFLWCGSGEGLDLGRMVRCLSYIHTHTD